MSIKGCPQPEGPPCSQSHYCRSLLFLQIFFSQTLSPGVPPGAGVAHAVPLGGIVVDEVEHCHPLPLRHAGVELVLVLCLPLVVH